MTLLTVNFSNFKNGKSLWKHNNSLLLDLEYIKCIKDKILDIKKQYALPVYNPSNIDNIDIMIYNSSLMTNYFLKPC